MKKVFEVELGRDLRGFSLHLYSQRIPHKITEERGKMVVWAPNDATAQAINEQLERWKSGDLHIETLPPASHSVSFNFVKYLNWRKNPLTVAFMALTSLIFLLTSGGTDHQMMTELTFVPLQIANGQFYPGTVQMVLDHGQYWRLITPMFIHFGVPHLAFNLLTFYIFASRIEQRHGAMHLLGLIIFSSVLSNFAQYYLSQQAAFAGGASGVVYGLAGYAMVRELLDRRWRIDIPRAYYGMMLFWLALGFTGIFGSMANGAHVGGLVAGIFIAALAAILFPTPAASNNNNED